MPVKKCIKCGEEKGLEEFHPHRDMRDGHLNECKPCVRQRVHTRWLAKQQDPEWAAREAERQRHKALKQYHEKRKHDPAYWDRHAAALERYRARFPEKARAWNLLATAISRGKIKRPDHCSRCGEKKRVEGHHTDYSKPLEVEWLCRQCHGVVSRKV